MKPVEITIVPRSIAFSFKVERIAVTITKSIGKAKSFFILSSLSIFLNNDK